MSADDPLADWARSRRSESVPEEFSRRVMEAISGNPGRVIEPQPVHRRRERLERVAGLLLVVCSCIVAVVRLSSLVDLVVPSTEGREITREFFDEAEEVSHVAPDVT